MNTICGYSVEEYKKMIKDFHGHIAPGLLIGGFMVDLAIKNKPHCEFYDFLCETSTCLPDAIQILTPCTYGNGWMKVVNIGRFALTLFDKYNGNGVRVSLSASKLDNFPEIKSWFFKLKKKDEQDSNLLFSQIIEAGDAILDMRKVVVAPEYVGKVKGGKIILCHNCGEAFPEKLGNESLCPACNKFMLYI